MNPKNYFFKAHPNIELWDIPGIGTPNFPDLKTYCKKVNIEIYDTFIIMTSERFTNNNLQLAKKLASINKPFFFARAKIDDNCRSEKKNRNFNEEKMLQKIRAKCYEGLKEQIRDPDDIFLISNNHPDKWDYPRLTSAISEKLSHRKREAFCLSIYTLSKDILKQKVDTLKGTVHHFSLTVRAVARVLIMGGGNIYIFVFRAMNTQALLRGSSFGRQI